MRTLLRLAPLGAAMLMACGGIGEPGDDLHGTDVPIMTVALVSNPVLVPSSSAGRASLHGAATEEVVYVSLPPGTLDDAGHVTIRNRRTRAEAHAALVDGGIDPVPIGASVGDTLELDVTATLSGAVDPYLIVVPADRPPIIVRTDPPPRKRDVPLNATMLIVFSEPIDPATLTSASVLLLLGATPVAGELQFADAAQLMVAFEPDAPLTEATEYTLRVTDGIRDLDGEALDNTVTVTFTTEGPTMPEFSVTISTDTATIQVQQQIGLRVTVRDDAGNEVFGRPTSWASTDPSVATVAAADDTMAVVTGIASGMTMVIATVEGASDTAFITVAGSGPALTFVTQPPDNMGVGLAFPVAVTVQDALGARDSSFSGDIRIVVAAHAGGGVLSGTTVRAATAGYAEFPDLRIDRAGTAYTLVASADGVDVVTSEPVDVLTVPTSGIGFTRGGDIHVMNVDGTGLVRLTTTRTNGGPAWSPDRSRIAFWRAGPSAGERYIYVMDADGHDATQLTVTEDGDCGGTWHVDPFWLPDGDQIAFSGWYCGGMTQIYVMNASGSGVTRLTTFDFYGIASSWGPSWSPDGARIAYAGYDPNSETTRIYAMNADGTGLTALTDGDLDMSPSWSPDGTVIAFVRDHGRGNRNIYLVNADGTGMTALTASGRDDTPAWSPDGAKIAFHSYRDGNGEVYVINRDGSGITNLTNDPASDDRSPSWSPVPGS